MMIDTGDFLNEPLGEYFELFNPTDAPIDIEGWSVEDYGATMGFVIANGGEFIVLPGETVTFCNTADPLLNGGFVPDYVYDPADFFMAGFGSIVLRDTTPADVDVVIWSFGTGYAPGVSMALLHPYLDNNVDESWVGSTREYGVGGRLGTPGQLNRDVSDDTQTAGLLCDDSNPCTVDVCNYDKANLCSHVGVFNCCQPGIDDCEDFNSCTVDACDPATSTCTHDLAEGCCLIDEDCDDVYPPGFDTTELMDGFDGCAERVCLGGSCRFARMSTRPGCCAAAAAPLGFGCSDRNTCTEDACSPNVGLDTETAEFYAMCEFDLDLDGNAANGNECCRTSADCDDGDPATIDVCDTSGSMAGCDVDPFQCCQLVDPDYCSDVADCDDGDPCTDDICCDGAGNPDAACTEANRCAHVAIAGCCTNYRDCADSSGCTLDACCTGVGEPLDSCTGANVCASETVEGVCCESRADCNGVNKPADMYCREGYCIGHVCRYAPPIDTNCCADETDCPVDPCTDYACNASHQCVGTEVPNCCLTSADCPAASDPCRTAVCTEGVCGELELPNCCEDDNPVGPDASCEDNNPCTADYCMPVGNFFQCRYLKVGGDSCCQTDASCPIDGVQCTMRACSAENECTLVAESDCLAVVPYEMTFTEGHTVYAGQYESLADIAWTTVDIAGSAASSFAFTDGASLGPDQYLTFSPTAFATNFEACVVTPRINAINQLDIAVEFEYAADLFPGGSARLRVRSSTTGDWQDSVEEHVIVINADTPSTSVVDPIAWAILEEGVFQVAICVEAATTDDILAIDIDTVRIIDGYIP